MIPEPEIAKRQINRIWDALSSLPTFPYSHQDHSVGRYASKGYKQFIVDNHLVVYRINEDDEEVYVVAVQ